MLVGFCQWACRPELRKLVNCCQCRELVPFQLGYPPKVRPTSSLKLYRGMGWVRKPTDRVWLTALPIHHLSFVVDSVVSVNEKLFRFCMSENSLLTGMGL